MQAVRPEARIVLERYLDVPALKPEQDGAAEAVLRPAQIDEQEDGVADFL